MHIVEVLNGWNREDDALAFLARSEYQAERVESEAGSTTTKGAKNKRRGKIARTRKAATKNSALSDLANDIVFSKSASQIDYGIGVARTHVAANDIVVEYFLIAIISQCDSDRERFETQSLKARSELLKFYNKVNRSLDERQTFLSAINAASVAMRQQRWNKEYFKSFEDLEALLELSAAVLRGSYEDEAFGLFNEIEHKAEDDFGWDEERTIWGNMSIGIIYESTKGWEYAKTWFRHAHSGSFAANGEKDEITKALDVALKKHHFPYLSDEGRPFKTIFGVSGMTIRPTRLHIN